MSDEEEVTEEEPAVDDGEKRIAEWLQETAISMNLCLSLGVCATTGQAAKKKCKERELLKLAYWKINRPK
jgi:hypothetical protein